MDRAALVDGLRQIIEILRASGEPAGIRIVGGAALSLRYFERQVTEDIDAKIYPDAAALRAANLVAQANGWPSNWLNSNATAFIPLTTSVEWELLFDEGDVSIWVASAPTLLAMKLKASRRGRDDDDIADLLAICEVTDIEEAESLFESFYPGEVLQERAYQILTVIFSQGQPMRPETPPSPHFA